MYPKLHKNWDENQWSYGVMNQNFIIIFMVFFKVQQ